MRGRSALLDPKDGTVAATEHGFLKQKQSEQTNANSDTTSECPVQTEEDFNRAYGKRSPKCGGKLRSSTRYCYVCRSKQHHASKCSTLLSASVAERVSILARKRLCFSCLAPGHSCQSCSAGRICGVSGCAERHHRLLHDHQWGYQNTDDDGVSSKSPDTDTD